MLLYSLASAFGKTEDDGDLEDEKPTNKVKKFSNVV